MSVRRTLGRTVALTLVPQVASPRDFHTMLDVLTAQPAHYRSTMFFLPFPRKFLKTGQYPDKETMELAKRELYEKVYQSIASLILAILNAEAVRRIRESVKLIETANGAYLDYKSEHNPDYTPVFDRPFEAAVQEARTIMADVEVLIERMAADLFDYDASRQIAEKCERFRNATLPIRDSRFASGRELRNLLPVYSLWLDRAEFIGVDAIVDAFNRDSIGQTANTSSGLRLRGDVERFHFDLRFTSRDSSVLGSRIPSDIPKAIDPIGLHIDSERMPTHFAPLLTSIEHSLATKFDALKLGKGDGRKVLVFCPSTALRGGTIAGLLD